MKCPNCKTDNSEGERFCWRCHIPLEEGAQKWAGHAAMVKGRKRIFKLLVLVGVVGALAFSALQIAYRRSPAAVVEAFTKARVEGDFRSMFLLLSRDSQKTLKRQGVRDIWPALSNVRYTFGVLEWVTRGNEARVRLSVSKEPIGPEAESGGAPITEKGMIRLIKEEGRWRIYFPAPGSSPEQAP